MILRDPVHGLVAFESEEDAIVPRLLGAPRVQRLRRIRQLGLTSLAFPGAEHTRFAHAIGAAHVMRLFLARLRQIDASCPSGSASRASARATPSPRRSSTTSGTARSRTSSRRRCPAPPPRGAGPSGSSSTPRPRCTGSSSPTTRTCPQRVADLVRGKHPLPYLAQRGERHLRRRSLRLPAARRARDRRPLRRLRSAVAPPQPALRRAATPAPTRPRSRSTAPRASRRSRPSSSRASSCSSRSTSTSRRARPSG